MLCLLNLDDRRADVLLLERALAKADLQAEIYPVKSADQYRGVMQNLRPFDELEDRALTRTTRRPETNENSEAFSYSVSHELTSSLLRIHAYLEFLKKNCGSQLDDAANGYLARAQKSANDMTRLTRDLLRLFKTSQSPLLRQRVDLSQMARAIASKLSENAPNRRVNWLITEGQVAAADPGLIQVVLENLLSNAWKYTMHSTQAQIEFGALTLPQGTVEYYIRDNGAGFDMTFVGQLFQPFKRLHGQDEFPGSGIGLATVRRIIERHGGEIWAQAEVGRGAVFRFTLGAHPEAS